MGDLLQPAPEINLIRQAKPGHTLIALLLGLILGTGANLLWRGASWVSTLVDITDPVGQVWLRALIMIVIPLVFASVCLGILDLGDFRRLRRVGLKLVAFILLTQALAAVTGMVVTNVIKPGAGMSPDIRNQLILSYRGEVGGAKNQLSHSNIGVGLLRSIVPSNPVAAAANGDMLGVVFVSLLFGFGMVMLPTERISTLAETIRGLGDVMIALVDLVMKAAPVGVFALVFSMAARFGTDVMVRLGLFLVVCLGGLVLFEVLVHTVLAWLLAGFRPTEFYPRITEALSTAFSTGSSNATLPAMFRVSESYLGLPDNICRFVLPIGVTMCKNGTALFDAVVVLFIAQAFGIHLGRGAQLLAVLMIVIVGLGTAGVPAATFPLLVVVLDAVGVPGAGIALVIGVDRIMDMCRTTVNVIGNIVAAGYIARTEGFVPKPG
jgi:dicarboxylate/amino acid:cation (Na+ or H+) symporter, DAACS family